jgi:hypothetical protein
MKFPITRESLQAFDFVKEQQEKLEEEIQKRFTQILDGICNEFQRTMQLNSKEKRFVWRNLHLLSSPHMIQYQYGTYSSSTKPLELDQLFIEKLKGVFIGCDIIVDPLKTYLIIDWS